MTDGVDGLSIQNVTEPLVAVGADDEHIGPFLPGDAGNLAGPVVESEDAPGGQTPLGKLRDVAIECIRCPAGPVRGRGR